MALSKIGNPKSSGIGAQLQAYIEKKAGESVEALQGAMSMPPIQPGQPIRGQKRRRVRMTGERISVPIVKVSPSDDTANTEGALAQCIIKAVVSRNLFRQPTDLDFLTLMCNWTAALSEGSDEIVAALNEAGYSAEVHVVDMSKEIKQKMKSLAMLSGRFLIPKKEAELESAMRAGETGEGDDAEVAAFQQWLDDNVENELLQKMSFWQRLKHASSFTRLTVKNWRKLASM